MSRRVSRAWTAIRAYLFGAKPRITRADVSRACVTSSAPRKYNF